MCACGHTDPEVLKDRAGAGSGLEAGQGIGMGKPRASKLVQKKCKSVQTLLLIPKVIQVPLGVPGVHTGIWICR